VSAPTHPACCPNDTAGTRGRGDRDFSIFWMDAVVA
jgi:hypothetical protein